MFYTQLNYLIYDLNDNTEQCKTIGFEGKRKRERKRKTTTQFPVHCLPNWKQLIYRLIDFKSNDSLLSHTM